MTNLLATARMIFNTKATEWAHGWETARVRATRYQNPHLGFNVGFSFPKNPHDCDRADMMDWLRENGVHVYSCGGYPGAEVMALVDGVKSKEAANEWLPTFLPRLDAWVKDNLH
jgi:hypothetical protein